MRERIVKELVKAVTEVAGEGYEVTSAEIQKNNGVILQAVVIRKDGKGASPVIYIDDKVDQIEAGYADAKGMAEEIFRVYRVNEFTDQDSREMIGKRYILDNVVYQIVNAERNTGRLADVPSRPVENLAAIYRVIVKLEGYTGSYTVSNRIMRNAGISFDELEKAARENTEREGFEIRTMAEIMGELVGFDHDMNGGPSVFVMTNKERMNGAAILLYEDQLAMLADRMQEDFFIIPSSIHELLAIPVSQAEYDVLKSMVKEVNDTQVMPEEILSYEVYRYYRETGELRVAV